MYFISYFEPFNMEIGQEMKFTGIVLFCNQIDLIIVPFSFYLWWSIFIFKLDGIKFNMETNVQMFF